MKENNPTGLLPPNWSTPTPPPQHCTAECHRRAILHRPPARLQVWQRGRRPGPGGDERRRPGDERWPGHDGAHVDRYVGLPGHRHRVVAGEVLRRGCWCMVGWLEEWVVCSVHGWVNKYVCCKTEWTTEFNAWLIWSYEVNWLTEMSQFFNAWLTERMLLMHGWMTEWMGLLFNACLA